MQNEYTHGQDNYIRLRKPLRLTRRQQFRKALTRVAITVEERLTRGKTVRELELALFRAVDRKLDSDPSFAWR